MNRIAPAGLAAVFALALLAGCGVDEGWNPGSTTMATISGTISGPDRPIRGEIALRPVTAPTREDIRIPGQSDSTGFFSLTAPAGAYTLAFDDNSLQPEGRSHWFCVDCSPAAYYAKGGLARHDQAEVLTLSAGEHRSIDVRLGALLVRVAVASSLEGRPVDFKISGGPDGSGFDFESQVLVTGGTVRVSHRAIPPGRYGVTLEIQDVEAFELPGARLTGTGEEIVVDAGQLTERTYLLEQEPGYISGVVHLGEHPSERITVRFSDSDHDFGTVEANPGGEFGLGFLWPAEARAEVMFSESRTSLWIGGGGFDDARRIEVQPGTSAPPIEVEDNALILDFGWVDPGGHWNATCEDLSGRPLTTLRGGSAARLLMRGLPRGSCRLRLGPREMLYCPWIVQWHDGVRRPEEATPIEIPGDGSMTRVELRLLRGGVIRGTVGGADDGAPAEAMIQVSPSGDPGTIWTRYASGDFAAEGLEDGSYILGAARLLAYDQPGEIVWHPGTSERDSATVFTIAGASTIEGVELAVP